MVGQMPTLAHPWLRLYLLFIYMIPIACKITNFPYTCLLTFLKHNNFSCLIFVHCFAGKNSWHASIINYWNTDKLCCVCYTSKEQHEKYLCNPSSHNRNTENALMKRAPQRLIIGKPRSQYASYSAMFCPLLPQNVLCHTI